MDDNRLQKDGQTSKLRATLRAVVSKQLKCLMGNLFIEEVSRTLYEPKTLDLKLHRTRWILYCDCMPVSG